MNSYNKFTIRKRIRELFPGFLQNGKATLLTPEQAEVIRRRIEHKDGYMLLRELVDQIGCHSDIIIRHIRELFPGLMDKMKKKRGKTSVWINPEQAAAIRERIKRGDGPITYQSLAAQLGVCKDTIKRRVYKLFPNITRNGRAAVLTPEQAEALIKAMNAPKAPVVRTYRGRKIVQLLKSGECSTHSQIAAGLGITDERLHSLLVGYTFSDCELSEDDEIIAQWPKSGIVLVKSGKLKNMTRKKEAGPAEHGPLLRYPPGQGPLQRGIHGGAR